jgi:probable rRNA maturation factor
MLTIQVDETIHLPLGEELVRLAVGHVLGHQGVSPESDLTVVFTTDEELRRLNEQFLGIDEPTDVLSFPAGFTDPETSQVYLGDVVISVPRATAQAGENQQTIQAEILLLVVHGVLHLLGHDHAAEAEKAVMWSAQAEILARLGS